MIVYVLYQLAFLFIEKQINTKSKGYQKYSKGYTQDSETTVSPNGITKCPFFPKLIRLFFQKSPIVPKKIRIKTIFLRPKTDRKARAYTLIRFRKKNAQSLKSSKNHKYMKIKKQLFNEKENKKVSQCQKNQRGDSSASDDFVSTLKVLKIKRRDPFVTLRTSPTNGISSTRYIRNPLYPVCPKSCCVLSKGTPLHFQCRMYIAHKDQN